MLHNYHPQSTHQRRIFEREEVRAQSLMAQTGATLEWVPRAQNEHADALSRVAYDEARAAHPSMEVQP